MVTRAIWIGTALLGLAAGTGFAAEIDFIGDVDGSTSTVGSITPPGALNFGGMNAVIFIDPSTDTVVVTGQLPLNSMPTGARQVILTEPSSSTVSDLMVLDAEAVAAAGFESIRIEFDSDTFPLFPLPTIPVVGTIPETGMTQDLSSLLQSGSLTITALSDVETPLPASAWSGLALLAGLATWRTVRRVKHTRA